LPDTSLVNDVFSIIARRAYHGPELQVVLRMSRDGSVDARLYRVTNGSAAGFLTQASRGTAEPDLRSIVNKIHVDVQRMSVTPETMKLWHSRLLDSLAASNAVVKESAAEYERDGSERAVLDGTQYDLWYQRGLVDLHWSVLDIDPENHGAPILPLTLGSML
jgi:hypothetical protein